MPPLLFKQEISKGIMKKIISNGLVSLAMLLCLVQGARAQMMINPVRVEKEIMPSSSIVESITLHNTSDREISIKAYWRDFIYTPPFSGKKDFLPMGASEYSFGDWIRFSPEEFVLPPKGKKQVNYSINVPPDIHGGYYGVLFFEQAPKALNSPGTGVSLVTRMGCLFFLQASNRNKSVGIENIKAESDGIVGEIANQGDVFVFPKGIYYLMDPEGLVSERGELEKIYLTPNNQTKFQVDIPAGLSPGKYTLVLTFDLKDGDSIVREIDFVKDRYSGLKVVEIKN